MNLRTLIITALFITASLALAACGGMPGQTPGAAPTPLPPVTADAAIVAEGRIVPRESVELSFFTSGQVTEVLVEEGDMVKAGDVVAYLGDREQLESSIANAELELFNAQMALKALTDNLPEAQTAALQAFNEARDALRDAEQKVNNFGAQAEALDIEVARANVALAKKALEAVEKDWKSWENKPESDFRRAAQLNKLRDAQERYDDAVTTLNRLTGVLAPSFDLEQARTELAIAQSRLALATEDYDLLKQGPDPDEVAAVERRIAAAEAAVVAAQAALRNLELSATIDGTVVEQNLIIGQQVSAGQPVMVITDFSKMYVETDDLTELEVVDVSLGQAVEIIPDALPELALSGVVEKINDAYEEKRGDITYTTRILIENFDPRLRWGMTVEVTFAK
jgi:multidrug resistance efflux pump